MSSLILVGAALLVASAVIARLVRDGLRHGDLESDVRVSAALQPVPGMSNGGWVAVTLTNPAPATALVGLELRHARPGERLMPVAGRSTGGPRTRLSVTDQVVGAVPGEVQERFWLWADRDPRRLCLLAAVGTEGRLRLHRLPLGGLGRQRVGRTDSATDRPAAPSVS